MKLLERGFQSEFPLKTINCKHFMLQTIYIYSFCNQFFKLWPSCRLWWRWWWWLKKKSIPTSSHYLTLTFSLLSFYTWYRLINQPYRTSRGIGRYRIRRWRKAVTFTIIHNSGHKSPFNAQRHPTSIILWKKKKKERQIIAIIGRRHWYCNHRPLPSCRRY